MKFQRPPGWFRAPRRCIAEEFHWRRARGHWGSAKWRLNIADAELEHPVRPRTDLEASQIAAIYRSLRNATEGKANEPGAADFYYGEMEMRKNDSSVRALRRSVIWLYWIIAGYGLRPLRPLLALGIVFIFMCLPMYYLGFDSSENDHSIGNVVVATAESIVPGLKVSASLSVWGRGFDVFLTVLGPILMGLMGLGIRNEVKR